MVYRIHDFSKAKFDEFLINDIEKLELDVASSLLATSCTIVIDSK